MYGASYMSGSPAQRCDSYTSSLYFTGSTSTATTTSCLGFPVTSTSSPWSTGSVPAAMAWSQTVPAYMPWAAPTLPEQNQEIMRFTAPPVLDPCTSQTATDWELVHNLGSTTNIGQQQQMHKHLKRRCEMEDDRPHKQYVTEEKMIAQLNDLRISAMKNDRLQMPSLEDLMSGSEEGSGTSSAQKESQGSIVLSPELQDFVSRDRLATECIIDDMRKRASMALVLWQPPSKVLSAADDTPESEAGEEETNNNNIGEDRASHAVMASVSSSAPDTSALFDSMDDCMDL